MFEVKLINLGVETVIHYPSPDKNITHLPSLSLKESLSMPEQLGFTILHNNPGYGLVNGLKTKVKVTDLRDNSVVFSGRVIPLKSSMSSEGEFSKEITCEGALSYLNDTSTRRWKYINDSPLVILSSILGQHNSKVEVSRRIQIGTVELTQPLTIQTNYETSLNAIITKVRNILGGDLVVRETAGVLYLDYLTAQGTNNEVVIRLGYNLKDMAIDYDPIDIVTRVIPLGYGEGIHQLGIKKVNSNIEYIEDAPAITAYGVIEGVATNIDIQHAATLKIYGQKVLNEKKQIKLVYSISQLDLSVLAGHESEKYGLGDSIHTICSVMGIDVYARVIERSRDLLNTPWNPSLVISTRPIRLSTLIVDLKQRNNSLEQAPQGSTCIFPMVKAENADSTHPITFDLDIPKETINIDRVYINLHGRKYRAYEKGTANSGGSTESSTSGGGGTSTSASGGGSTSGASSVSTSEASDTVVSITNVNSDTDNADGPGSHYHGFNFTHSHLVDPHIHGMAHTHQISAHSHDVSIPSHTHDIDIPSHFHSIDYGIYESTFPKNVKIKVRGVDIGVNYAGDSAIDEYDIDITDKVLFGNNKIEISTEQEGRIDAIIYTQIFIQAE